MTDAPPRPNPPEPVPDPGSGVPTPPIDISGGAGAASSRLPNERVVVPDDVVARLRDVCPSVTTEAADCAEASRDWWPLAMTWATEGELPGLASVVARPSSAPEVAAVLQVCNDARIPVTAAAGRSGVCGS